MTIRGEYNKAFQKIQICFKHQTYYCASKVKLLSVYIEIIALLFYVVQKLLLCGIHTRNTKWLWIFLFY